MEFILAIIFWIIGLWILYCVIKSAIDNSETAQNIKILTNMLSKEYSSTVCKDENDQEMDISIDRCPACGAKISEQDEACSSCGLKIISEIRE
ncbi:MAG: zinc ribbon domain-containing protein [Syntrophomonadaceae bacterium]|nr:zinc ribbon domain-containing protein [Syntrophomonadaceae bacterium]